MGIALEANLLWQQHPLLDHLLYHLHLWYRWYCCKHLQVGLQRQDREGGKTLARLNTFLSRVQDPFSRNLEGPVLLFRQDQGQGQGPGAEQTRDTRLKERPTSCVHHPSMCCQHWTVCLLCV